MLRHKNLVSGCYKSIIELFISPFDTGFATVTCHRMCTIIILYICILVCQLQWELYMLL